MWAQLLSTVVGLWLMAAPAVLGHTGIAATSDRIVGPIAATFAVVAASEVTRGVRRANAVCGVWLLLAPWIFSASWPAIISDTCAGLALLSLSFVRGRIKGRYGGGWPAIWKRQQQPT